MATFISFTTFLISLFIWCFVILAFTLVCVCRCVSGWACLCCVSCVRSAWSSRWDAICCWDHIASPHPGKPVGYRLHTPAHVERYLIPPPPFLILPSAFPGSLPDWRTYRVCRSICLKVKLISLNNVLFEAYFFCCFLIFLFSNNLHNQSSHKLQHGIIKAQLCLWCFDEGMTSLHPLKLMCVWMESSCRGQSFTVWRWPHCSSCSLRDAGLYKSISLTFLKQVT